MQSLFVRLLGLRRNQKIILQLFVDGCLVAVSFLVALWLRLDSIFLLPNVWTALLVTVPLSLLAFYGLGLYRTVIRFLAGRALQTVFLGSMASGLILAASASVLNLPLPRSIPLLHAMLMLISVGGVRFVFREVLARSQNHRKERVAIFGAGAAGRQLAQTLLQGNDYLPIAFLDDSPEASSTLINGLRVRAPTPENIGALIRNNSVTSVLLAIPSASRSRRSEVLKSLEKFPLRLRTIPGLHDIVSGRAAISDINEVSIEDLLGRDPVPPRPELMGANIRGKSVMVTGAGGSIGSELCRQILRQAPAQLVLFEQSELALYSIEADLQRLLACEGLAVPIFAVLGSVQDAQQVTRALRQFHVNTVYHAAAYKHVPLVEHNVAEGVRNNVLGTRTVAESAIATRVEAFILISTDKAVRPTNIMGATKRMAEMVCQALADLPDTTTRISMVRFGNVLGSSGSVIPLFSRQIEAGGPLTVTHPDITRYFMTIPEAAQLVIQSGAMAKGGDVFVLDMGEPVRIADLAAQMVRLHGMRPVVLDAAGPKTAGPGEIGIAFTELRPGEKLFEELLIGNAPCPTAHPRIMSANESYLPLEQLNQKIAHLICASSSGDVRAVRRILAEAGTGYAPTSRIVDHFGGLNLVASLLAPQVAPVVPQITPPSLTQA